MRCAFPPYGLRATGLRARLGHKPMVRKTHPTKDFSGQHHMLWMAVGEVAKEDVAAKLSQFGG
jgi:hypothetical protein